MKKREMRMRPDFPAIEGVESATSQKQRISEITKPSHSVQIMIRPEASPMKTFSATLRIISMGATS
jgi:hypothetical protein